jgi:hypothetical protein
VAGLGGALVLLGGERRLVDQEVGAVGGDPDRVARRGVPRQDDPPPRPGRADDLGGVDARHRLAALQAAEVGPERDAELGCALGVEAPRARLLDDRVAERGAAVADVERLDRVPLREVERVAAGQVDDVERVRQAPDHAAHGAQELLGARRPVDGQGPVAVAQGERLDHPHQAEPVVDVVVGEEDDVEVGQPDGAQELALGALAAVEQQPVAAPPDEHRREPAPRGGHGAAVPAKKTERSVMMRARD